MQFLILAHDATDADALKRRMEHREAHLACIARYKAAGHMHIGAALLDGAGTMTGSAISVPLACGTPRFMTPPISVSALPISI